MGCSVGPGDSSVAVAAYSQVITSGLLASPGIQMELNCVDVITSGLLASPGIQMELNCVDEPRHARNGSTALHLRSVYIITRTDHSEAMMVRGMVCYVDRAAPQLRVRPPGVRRGAAGRVLRHPHRGPARHDGGAVGGAASEKAAKLAQKLGQLHPFIVVFPQECMGRLAYFGPT